jgi:membrane-bound serine protease (ClpP class)
LIFVGVYGILNTQMITDLLQIITDRRNVKVLCLIIVFLAFLLPQNSYSQTKIKVLTLQGDIINPVTADYIEKGLEIAERQDCLLIIRIDTPGGLLKSTEKIVKLILNSPVPVISYVYPKGARAASAGVFIGYASNILAMSPSTHIGAAHPVVGMGSWGKLDQETRDKILNDTLAWAKNISQVRNRPFIFIKDAIEKSISITEEEALIKGVSDLTADNLDELLKGIDGLEVQTSKGKITISTKDAVIEEIGFTKREQFLNILIEPNIAYLLLTLGFLGLIFEVTHPGFGFPGIAGIICILLSFYALSVLPVNYAGLALIILGIIFFVVEALTPTFGMFTLGGVISFFLGSIMLFNQPQFIKVSLKIILPLVITLAGFSLFILSKAIATMRQKPRTGKESLIGEKAFALTNIKADKPGQVSLHGEIWKAQAQQEIKKGETVIVTDINGLIVTVQRKGGK